MVKGEAVAPWDWLRWVWLGTLPLPKHEDTARISKNLETVRSIHEWAKEVLDLLQSMAVSVRRGKASVAALSATLE